VLILLSCGVAYLIHRKILARRNGSSHSALVDDEPEISGITRRQFITPVEMGHGSDSLAEPSSTPNGMTDNDIDVDVLSDEREFAIRQEHRGSAASSVEMSARPARLPNSVPPQHVIAREQDVTLAADSDDDDEEDEEEQFNATVSRQYGVQDIRAERERAFPVQLHQTDD
jgi:hypothetical protein